MTPISPSKYAALLERYAALTTETEEVRSQIVTAYDELWLQHLDLLKKLSDAHCQTISLGGIPNA